MHIVYLVHRFPIEGMSTGGAGNYVANMAKIMKTYGHKVTVITEADTDTIFDWEGIEIRKIRATRWFKDNGRPMKTYKKVLKNICRSFFYNWEALQVNKKCKVDIIQSASSYGIPYLRVKNIPYIVRVSEYPPLWSGAAREEFDYESCVKAKRLDESISFKGMERADKILMPSNLMQQLIDDRVGKKGIVVESPIVLGDTENMPLEEKQIVKDKYLVMHGALSYRKCIHILKPVIKSFFEQYPHMKFVIIGRDKELLVNGNFVWASDYLKQDLQENESRLMCLGEIKDRQRLFSMVKNAYACVLPTRIDNLPNSVLEAMALGKIVISSTSERGTSVEQLITDNENGYLAQVDDAKDLLAKIEMVMNLSPEEKRKMEELAKERVKDLTPDKVYFKMMEVYEDVISRKTTGR